MPTYKHIPFDLRWPAMTDSSKVKKEIHIAVFLWCQSLFTLEVFADNAPTFFLLLPVLKALCVSWKSSEPYRWKLFFLGFVVKRETLSQADPLRFDSLSVTASRQVMQHILYNCFWRPIPEHTVTKWFLIYKLNKKRILYGFQFPFGKICLMWINTAFTIKNAGLFYLPKCWVEHGWPLLSTVLQSQWQLKQCRTIRTWTISNKRNPRHASEGASFLIK